MKAISDVKMKEIIRRILQTISQDVEDIYDLLGKPDAIVEITSKAEFNNAMIEQAGKMNVGAERLVYFVDKVPTVFYNGYAIAKLYTVESRELGAGFRVCADIYTGSKWFMTVTKDNEGAWTCSDIVRVATNTDLENYYTAQQIDQKLANIGSGGSAGMCREFQATAEGMISGDTSWSYAGTASRLYTITVRRLIADTVYFYPLTVDYKVLSATKTPFRIVTNEASYATVNVHKNSSGVHFEIVSSGGTGATTASFAEICGYY